MPYPEGFIDLATDRVVGSSSHVNDHKRLAEELNAIAHDLIEAIGPDHPNLAAKIAALTTSLAENEEAVSDFAEMLDGSLIPGKSAYEIAVQNGFVGTEAAWLASLEGAKLQGPPGLVYRPGGWQNATSYTVDDVVRYDGRGYVALKPSNGVVPGTDATTWDLLVDRGAAGPAGSGAAGQITPLSLGLKGWTFDPILHAGDNGRTYPGQVWGARISLGASIVVAVHYRVWIAGTGMIAGQNFIGLVSIATGQRVAVTADQTTNFSSIGAKRALFTTTPDLPAGEYYVGILCNTTGGGANPNNIPSFATARGGDTDLMNFRAVGQQLRAAKIGTEFDVTAFPAAFDFAGNSANNRLPFLAIE